MNEKLIEMEKKTKIWSRRFTPARGNHWVEERDCKEADVQAWLEIFRGDESNVCFIASPRRPRK